MFLLNTSTKRTVLRKEYTMKSRYEIVLKVAEMGNITRAAEALNYTQSGVSHAVAAIEKETGCTLFSRCHSGVIPTENGKVILEAVRGLVRQQQAYEETVYRINHVVAGRIRLGTFSSFTSQYLPELISGFSRRYPQVKFDLLDGNYDEIQEWLSNGTADCGFISRSALSNSLKFLFLMQDPLLLTVSRNHPLAGKKYVSAKELLCESLIIQAKGCDNDIQMFLSKQLQKADIFAALKDDLSVLSFVEHGFGVAIMPKLVTDAHKPDVCTIPLAPAIFREIGLSYLSTERLTLACKMFIDFTQHYFSDI